MVIRAAVFRRAHKPLTIESVEIDRPMDREVLVRTAATGVCHSDLHHVEGLSRYAMDRPAVLGHEGADVVEAVGDAVTTVRPGDYVVACLSGFCGSCAQCLSGHPNLCVGGIVTSSESAPPRLSQQPPSNRCDVEGQNIAIEWRWAHGKNERYPDLAAELVELKVDIIVAATTAGLQAAQRATRTIPIAMGFVTDPVAQGFVANLVVVPVRELPDVE